MSVYKDCNHGVTELPDNKKYNRWYEELPGHKYQYSSDHEDMPDNKGYNNDHEPLPDNKSYNRRYEELPHHKGYNRGEGWTTKCRSHCHYDHELSFWNISGHSLSYACTSLLLLSFGRHYYGLITNLTLSGPFQIIFQILIGYLYDIQINDNNAIGSLCLYLFGNNPVFHVYLNSVILKIWCIFRVLN